MLASESRRAGVPISGRCFECGAVLRGNDTRCADCQPQLSSAAKAAGIARQQRDAALLAQQYEIHQIENAIRRVERALRKWPQIS